MAKPIKIWDGSQWVDVAINVPSITGHADDTTNIHGIANTDDLATKSYADSAVSTHSSDTTSVHGITNTADIVYSSDSRLTDSRTPTAHASSHGSAGSDAITIAQSQVTNLTTDLSAKAPLESPSLTGIPTAPTAAALTNTTQLATTAFVRTEVSNIVDAAPSTLDTLNELAAALGDDPNFATTVTNSIATKAPLDSPTFTGTVTLPSATSIGNVSSTELGYLDGVTSSIQTQLSGKANLSGATFTSNILVNSNNEWNINIRSASTTSTNRNHFLAQRSNGTSAVTSGFNLGGLTISGFDGTNYGYGWNGGVEINAYATETWTSTARGTSVSIWNTPNGSTNITERLKIDQDGRVRVFQVLEAPVVTNAQTGTSYTLVLADAGKAIEMNNAAANTLTVPTDASVNFPVGTVIDIFQTGAGQTTIGGAGVTINARPGLKLSGQWATATLIKRGTNTWLLTGSLSA